MVGMKQLALNRGGPLSGHGHPSGSDSKPHTPSCYHQGRHSCPTKPQNQRDRDLDNQMKETQTEQKVL